MTTIVYGIACGSWSDYCIAAVFSTKVKALNYIKATEKKAICKRCVESSYNIVELVERKLNYVNQNKDYDNSLGDVFSYEYKCQLRCPICGHETSYLCDRKIEEFGFDLLEIETVDKCGGYEYHEERAQARQRKVK